MKHFCTTFMIILLSIIINTVNSYLLSTIKSVKLSPAQKSQNGANVMFNVREVTPVDETWNVNPISQNTWQFILSIDNSFGFDSSTQSSITITIDTPTLGPQELLFGFTTNNKQYISTLISLNTYGQENKIYPACDQYIKSPPTPFGIGDIASLPNQNRLCDISGGNCANWQHMLPSNHFFTIISPITFTLENDPSNNQLIFYFKSQSTENRQIFQKCKFAMYTNMYTNFVSNDGLKIYMAQGYTTRPYQINSFDITSHIKIPTVSPTKQPTKNPTISPTNKPTFSPTHNPSVSPTNNPTTSPTKYPTNYPTITPTNNPSKYPSNNPTVSPTNNPTKYPTKYPTNFPSKTPSYNPSITPTKYPTMSPSKFPTKSPSKSPSKFPTKSPSKFPTKTPSKFPTKSPSKFPSKSPTKYPSNYPTVTPTKYPTITPSKFPTNFPSKYPTHLPTKSPTNNPTNNPSNRPSYGPSHDPTITPTNFPSKYPTISPSKFPSISPSLKPTYNPSITPSKSPSNIPSTTPTNFPSISPTLKPTNYPSASPIKRPTYNPTQSPSNNPSNIPTTSPSNIPTMHTPSPLTMRPTNNPSKRPTNIPSNIPTTSPTTLNPTMNPTTAMPTKRPTPIGFQWGVYDQLCATNNNNVFWRGNEQKCDIFNNILLDINGNILCDTSYDCCMCEIIQCNNPCHELRVIGDYGMYGVKDIHLNGDPYTTNGVSIDCQGIQSCKDTNIYASHVNFIDCDGEYACSMAVIKIIDPKNGFVLECAGVGSCEGLQIDILFSAPDNGFKCNPNYVKEIFEFTKISCNNNRACEGLQIRIQNDGCDNVQIESLECIQPNSCNNAIFNFIGDVIINNCLCGPSCNSAIGLNQCFNNLEKKICFERWSCTRQTKIIENPRNGFYFECSAYESCALSNFVIELNNNPTKLENVNHISTLLMDGEYAAKGATFRIDNKQGSVVTLGKIQCSGQGSCQDTTFITGMDVMVEEITCAPQACVNCQIKQTINGPSIPCDPSQISQVLQI